VANSFLAAGGDGFAILAQGTNRTPGKNDVDAFEAYVTASSPVQPPALGRLTIAP